MIHHLEKMVVSLCRSDKHGLIAQLNRVPAWTVFLNKLPKGIPEIRVVTRTMLIVIIFPSANHDEFNIILRSLGNSTKRRTQTQITMDPLHQQVFQRGK